MRLVTLVFALIAGCGTDPTGMPMPMPMEDAGVVPDSGELSHDEALRMLGIDTALAAGPTDSEGRPLPDDYHPLRTRYNAIQPREEIYFAGYEREGVAEGLLQDGFTTTDPFAPMFAPTDASWALNAHKDAVGADVDGDGIQEVVAVYYVAATQELRIKVIDAQSEAGVTTVTDGTPFVFATGVEDPGLPNGWFSHSVAASDLDGDGRDEIIVGFRDLYILTWDEAADHHVVTGGHPYASTRISVAAGDFDAAPGDRSGEFVVAYVEGDLAYVDHYDGTTLSMHQTTLFTLNDPARTDFQMHEAFVFTGNFDRDVADEIAFYGPRRHNGQWHIVMQDDARAGFEWFKSFQFWVTQFEWEVVPALAALDMDGDGVDEIFAEEWLLQGLAEVPASGSTAVLDAGAGYNLHHPADGVTQVVFYDAAHGGGGAYWNRAFAVAAGNVLSIGDTTDRAAREELITIRDGEIRAYGFDGTGRLSHRVVNPGGAWHLHTDVLAVANVDDDTAIVRYDNEHELLFSDPQVLVTMSAPPFWAGMDQNVDACSTAFGFETATSMGRSQTMGVSVGWSVGYEWSDPFGIASASFSVSMETSFDWTASNSREVAQSVTFTGGAEDSVVFTAVPFDVYYYTVISSPDPEDVGNRLTINVPRHAQTLLVSREFYEAIAPAAVDLSGVFSHTIGDPRSYRSVADRDNLCDGGCSISEPQAVPQGGGSQTVQVSRTDTTGQATAFDHSTTVEAEVGAGGFTVGVSAGFHYGFEIETSVSETTTFSGTVGGLETRTGDNAYSFGIFAYEPALGGRAPAMAIDYWVE